MARVKWKCGSCGRQAAVARGIPVRCKCGVISVPRERGGRAPLGEGVGTELHRLLERFGHKMVAGCKCPARIRTMNKQGVGWCADNKPLILSWLKEEALRQGKSWGPVQATGASVLIRAAVRAARRKLETS